MRRAFGRVGSLRVPMGDGLLGRVVDAQGCHRPCRPLQDVVAEAMDRRLINAMDRDPVREPMDTGVRAINALLTVGRGRVGAFAGSGVGRARVAGHDGALHPGGRDRGG